ncbi:hypothetical protein F511_37896 [Dorcoceras hygrometricum]|uniref:Uncharacterized protein n=1 Tax=Dorcoceras hygrometricum TaxID=472368 RepID=A0A2Z7CSK0_9LAMI|nr:hypothetical protein F511_37896 [Dorcoceras hygrometricum]
MAGDRRNDRNNGGKGSSNPNTGGGLSREDLMAIATIVATTLQGLVNPNNNQAPPPPRGTKFYYESLRKNKAPTFDGSHDPEVAQTNPNTGGGLSREDLMAIATIVATTLQGIWQETVETTETMEAKDPPIPIQEVVLVEKT